MWGPICSRQREVDESGWLLPLQPVKAGPSRYAKATELAHLRELARSLVKSLRFATELVFVLLCNASRSAGIREPTQIDSLPASPRRSMPISMTVLFWPLAEGSTARGHEHVNIARAVLDRDPPPACCAPTNLSDDSQQVLS